MTHGRLRGGAMEVKQLGYQRTLVATPSARFDVVTDPHGIPARGDRDWRLVDTLRRREVTAAERLVATFGHRAYRLAIGITGNRQDAEEAVQDSFWNVVRGIDTFRGRSSFRSWVYRITANAAYQKRRRGAHRPNEITLDEVLPRFDEDGRHTDTSPTGRRSSPIRRCKESCATSSHRRSTSYRPTIARRSPCATSKGCRSPKSPRR